MADLPQAAPSVEACVSHPDFKSNSSQILGSEESGSSPWLLKHGDEHQHHQNSSGDGHAPALAADVEVNTEINETQERPCQSTDLGKLTSTQDGEKQECGIGFMMVQQVGDDVEGSSSPKASESACSDRQEKICGIPDDRVDGVVDARVSVDVDAHSTQMDKISVSAGEVKLCDGDDEELSPTKKVIQNRVAHSEDEPNGDASSLLSERREEQSVPTLPLRKLAVWSTPVSPEPEFIMEASSWPTLAEARHVKPSQARPSISKREVAAVSLPAERVSSSQVKFQEHPVEAIKHTHVNTSVSGSKYRSPYKKGSYGKPSFPAMENLPLPPMGVHVPSANMFTSDQSVKGNGLMVMNNFYPGPQQVPAQGSFYYPRAEALAPSPHYPVAPSVYGRGHPGWQHYGRGYGDTNYRHTGFVPPYDPHMGPRHMRPLVMPFMNMNVAQYNYPGYQGDMAYMLGTPVPGFHYGIPYYGPPQSPPGPMLQASADIPSIQEKLQKQIEYYFSVENLCHDTFLTSKMDDEGFVPISLIASFPRVKKLTLNAALIVEAMKNSTLVEMKNGKLRSHDWRRWKPTVSGTSKMQGTGRRGNSLGPLNHTGLEHMRNGETEGSKLPQEGPFDNGNSIAGE